jgi:7 transmembrane sweet-taste receptor of 3 GCPR
MVAHASLILSRTVVNVIILMVMTVLSPPTYTRTNLTYDLFGRPSSSYGHCLFDEQKWYLLALCILNVGILLCSIYQAYQARHLSTEFSESRYIFKALLIIMLALFVGVPVVALSYENPSAVAFISSAMVTIVCMTVLLYIFIPKIQFGVKERRGSGLSPTAAVLSGVSGFNMPAGRQHFDDGGHGSSLPTSGRESTSTDFGDRIVTTKTASELAAMIHQLERQLDEKDRLLKENEGKNSVGGQGEAVKCTNEGHSASEQSPCDEKKDECITLTGNVENLDNDEECGESNGHA